MATGRKTKTKKSAAKSTAKDLRVRKDQTDKVKGGMLGPPIPPG